MPFNQLTMTVAHELMILMADKRLDKAADLLSAELQKDPPNMSLQRELADVLRMDGRNAEAIAMFKQLAHRFADDLQFTKAVAMLKKVQQIDPGNPEVQAEMASLIDKEKRQRVRDLYREAGQFLPDETMGEVAVSEGGSYIVGTPLFGNFTKEELLALVDGMRLLTFEPGDVIVGEGEPGDSLFVLTSGTVKAFVRNADGRFRKVRQMNDGDFFGEIAILTGQPRTATITAATPCELLELTRATMETMSETHPGVREVLRDYCERRAQTSAETAIRRTSAEA